MKNQFQVHVLGFTVLQEIAESRSANDYVSLLDAMEFGDTIGNSDDELRELCIMSLQDQQPEEAAALVLKHDLGDRLNDGQIRNIANEMIDEKMWEEYADMSLHERMFNVGSLLYAAFPQTFPEPDAVRVKIEVVAVNDSAKAAVAKPLHESLLVRLLADGMNDQAILHRLFDKQLEGKSFQEADMVVWIIQTDSPKPHALNVEVISSGYWLDSLRNTKSYESTAYAD